jgi:hypothetical protein
MWSLVERTLGKTEQVDIVKVGSVSVQRKLLAQ